MKGNDIVIKELNKLLTGELTAMDIYFLGSRMFDDWGIDKLHEQFAHEFEDEKGHASSLITRILFLEGVPDVASRQPFKVGANTEEILKNDLEMEYEVAANLKDAIKICEDNQDYVTREMLEKLLVDTEEDHIDWLETQIDLIGKMGIQNYIQSKSS